MATRVEPAAVVVDPYSSGKYMLAELQHRNIPIIAVRSTTKMSDQFLRSHKANQCFFAEFLEFEDMDECLEQLSRAIQALPYQVLAVLPGSEPGVELANRLSDKLGLLTTNPLELLPARTDKAEMQEALRICGVPAAKQYKSGDLEQLQAWAKAGNEWPLVAKPVGGAGSEGIFFCKSEDDIAAAHQHIVGNRSSTGSLNEQLALQEFLDGDEYIVDTVSHGGKHLCIAIWVYKKVKGLPWNRTAIMCERSTLLPASGEKQDILVDYVFQVLDAVGLQHGPCHTEVMFTQRGPILVEVNARMHGLQGPRLIELCTGISKAAYAADVIVGGGDLFKRLYRGGDISNRYLYPLNRHCILTMLLSPVEGYLQHSFTDAISDLQLPSLLEVLPSVQKGDYMLQTKDLPTLAGTVLLVHESADQIEADYQCIRATEATLALYPILSAKEKQELSAMAGRKGVHDMAVGC
jgi:biotin carboxylase